MYVKLAYRVPTKNSMGKAKRKITKESSRIKEVGRWEKPPPKKKRERNKTKAGLTHIIRLMSVI